MALVYCPTLEPDTPPWVAAVCVAAGHRTEQCVCKCLAHVCLYMYSASIHTPILKKMRGCHLPTTPILQRAQARWRTQEMLARRRLHQ